VVEDTTVDEQYGTIMGTDGYLVNVELPRRLLNWLPILDQKIKFTYNSNSRTCSRHCCFQNSELECEKRSWEQYKAQF
jgi:hypothetical protein